MNNQEGEIEEIYGMIRSVEIKEQKYLKLLYSKYFLVWGILFILYSWLPVLIFSYYYKMGILPFIIISFSYIVLTTIGILVTNSLFAPIKRFSEFRIKIAKRTIPIGIKYFYLTFYTFFFLIGILLSYLAYQNRTGFQLIMLYVTMYIMLLILDLLIIRGIILSFSKLTREGWISGVTFTVSIIISLFSFINFRNSYPIAFTIVSIVWTLTGIAWMISALLSYKDFGGSPNGRH